MQLPKPVRLGQVPSKIKGSFSERIDLWAELARAIPENELTLSLVEEVRSQAILLKDVRNLITHGLCGGNSQPDEDNARRLCHCAAHGA